MHELSQAARVNVSADMLRMFADDFHASGRPSVDAFLFDRKEDYGDLVKVAVATLFSDIENRFPIIVRRGAGDQMAIGAHVRAGTDNYWDEAANTTAWYKPFFNAIFSNKAECFRGDIKIITFNYDRSFEFHLEAFLRSIGLSTSDIERVFANLEIIHVYGCLGFHPAHLEAKKKGAVVRAYGDKNVTHLCNSLHMLTFIGDNPGRAEEIKEITSASKEIYFVGFGFSADNLKILGMKMKTSERAVMASTLAGNDWSFDRVVFAQRLGIRPEKIFPNMRITASQFVSRVIGPRFAMNLTLQEARNIGFGSF
ncbi:MAG: hypothetical protein AB7K68_09450 [Bacteriovoracia bacterium]